MFYNAAAHPKAEEAQLGQPQVRAREALERPRGARVHPWRGAQSHRAQHGARAGPPRVRPARRSPAPPPREARPRARPEAQQVMRTLAELPVSLTT